MKNVDGSCSTGSATTPASDPVAVLLAALAGAILGFCLSLDAAALVAWPEFRPVAGVISWVSDSDHAKAKARELRVYSYALALVPLLSWLFGRAAKAILTRRPDAGSVLAPLALISAAWILAARRPFAIETATWNSFVRLLLGGISIFPATLAAAWSWDRFAPAIRRFCAGPTIPSFLLVVVPSAIFLLATGPRIANDVSLTIVASRLLALFAGLAVVCLGFAATFSARPSRSAGPAANDFAERVAWTFGFLLLARFAPEDPRIVGGAVAATIVALLWSAARGRTSRYAEPPADPRRPWRIVDRVLLPCLVVTLVFHRTTDGNVDFFHEGEYLTPAFEVLRGEVPYVDVYLQHGLGRNVLRTLAAFQWSEVSLAAERLSRNLFVALSHAGVYLLLLSAFRSRVLALAVALMSSTPEFALDWRFLFPLLALALVARDLHAPRPANHFLAGVACAIAFFVSTDLGVYTFVAISIFSLVDGARGDGIAGRISRILRLAFGAAAGSAPFLIAIARWGALDAFVANVREQIGLQLSVWALPWPPLDAALAGREPLGNGDLAAPIASPTLLALAAATLYLAVPTVRCIVGFARTATPSIRAATLLAIAGLVIFRSALGRSDVGHLRFASIYALLLASGLALAAYRAAAASRLPGSLRSVLGLAPGAMLLLYACIAYTPLYALANPWIRLSASPPARGGDDGTSKPPLPHLGDCVIPIDQARALATLDTHLATELGPTGTFYDFSNCGALYALLGRPAPTRYFMPVYAATPAMQDAVIADLEREQPRLVFIATCFGLQTIDGKSAHERAPRIASYLERTYDEPSFIGIGFLARRRAASEPDSDPASESSGNR